MNPLSRHFPYITVISACLALSSCYTQLQTSEPQQAPLTSEQHLMKAQRYKQAGRIELSRASLLDAIKTDPDSHAAKLAQDYLKYNLPKEPVSLEAEQRNVIAFNLQKNGDIKGAKENLHNLIKDFPNFEWPYANLASIYATENNLEEAERLLKKALSINPDYANARGLLLKIEMRKEDAARKNAQEGLMQPD